MANIFITGASTGIGEATALRLDRLGHTVFAGVRKDADGDRLRAAASDRLTPVSCDVTDQASIDGARKTIGEAVGSAGLQGLVNNAGVAIGGRHANPMLGPYTASKHAIEAVGQALRGELEPWGIHVSVVEPGAIKTPIWDKGRDLADELEDRLGPEATQQYAEGIAFVRKGIDLQEKNGAPPEKVAEAFEKALFDARPRTQYLVGTDAKVLGTLNRLLPRSFLDRLVKRLGPS